MTATASDQLPRLHSPDRSRSYAVLAILTLLVIAATYERWQGRVWWCACGKWYPISLQVQSMHNSQHLLDPYSLSHVLHGLIFFGLFWLIRDKLSFPWRLVGATLIEVIWEMSENSPFIISRYRSETASLGYTGDSIANSLGDIGSLIVGFYIARKIGLWWSIALAITVELVMLWWIRDNLTLNVLMLVWPIKAIRNWQAGA